jgi:hypothetical protein
MKGPFETETMAEAFEEIAYEAFHGQLKPGSGQYIALKKFFFAGGLFLAIKARDSSPETVHQLLNELEDYIRTITSDVEAKNKIKEDIERSAQ